MAAIELVSNKASKTPFPAHLRVAWQVRNAALQRGIVVRGSGDNVVLCPPLTVERKHLDQVVRVVEESIGVVSENLAP